MSNQTKRVPLSTLSAGARFALPNDDGTPRRTGTLLSVTESSARVRFDGEGRHVKIESVDGVGAEFDVPGKPVNIAASTEVVELP